MDSSESIIIQKLMKFLEDEETSLYQKLVKFADDIPEAVLATCLPRESSVEMGEFTTSLREYHLRYQRLIEEQIEQFLRKEGCSNEAFLEALREGEEEEVQMLLSMIESLSDIDIFCAMIDDVKHGRF